MWDRCYRRMEILIRMLAIESKQGGSSDDKFLAFSVTKRVPQKLKGKFYGTTIRPAILYGAECWPTKIQHVQQLSVAEMRILRWICGHTRIDRVRNDGIRDRLEVVPIEEKLVQPSIEVVWPCPKETSRGTSIL